MCQGSFDSIKKLFKEVLKKFQGCFKCVSRKGISRMSQGCLKRFFSGFQGYFKEVQRNVREVSKVFHGNLKGVLRKF